MRKTDEQVLDEYFQEMEIDKSKIPAEILQIWIGFVSKARRDEPRINSGCHYIDWCNICDDDDDFDSFYGPDYFENEDTGLNT